MNQIKFCVNSIYQRIELELRKNLIPIIGIYVLKKAIDNNNIKKY